ncbi:hypothetical protein Pla108_26480 [Botrimarina colliarenosi]|uniref:Mucoidy inhibitor MuiA family protein n=1 Tax=Botrimarina colliarenosi TaxID=2528001 RepID=A0A5C6AF76_9BACT|nr:mucoidy inhibitor MuiA family protein [Botrimarina colliarenosi]TWT96873.1 hypothetical protein Pla108_26480 [Botrimarina colliarenosi]
MARPLPLVLLALAMATTAAAEPLTLAGKLTAVTVFQGQALVTRDLELPATAGLVEVVVTDLPEQLLAGSLYAEPGEGVEVRSVRTRNRPVSSAPREEVQKLQERIAELGRQRLALQRERAMLTQRLNYLNQLETFTAGKAREDLHTGVLDAEALRELTNLVFTQREATMERELEAMTQDESLAAEQQLAQRELATLTGGDDKTTREAVVFLNKEAGAASVRLMYLVGGANWSPSYNVRAKEDRSGVTLEYNASVTQMSGEDWTDVEMTLSTATPSLVATPPKLDPLTVRLAAAMVQQESPGRSKSELSQQQRALATNRGNFALDRSYWSALSSVDAAAEDKSTKLKRGAGGGGFGAIYANSGPNVDATDKTLNSLACAVQLLDLQAGDIEGGLATTDGASTSEGLSVVYRLPNKTSLPSRSDQQLIQVAALPLEAEFYRIATPVLTSYVYQEAKLTNATKHVLLAGPSATFLGDRFVGRGEIPQAAIGESFTVGLGIDESLRASRELADKSDRVQGGNRIARFDYVLTIENFGDAETEVRVLDRLPKSDGDAIKVTLVESDPEAEDAGEDDGLLRWDVKAPAAGETTVSYTMTIEHDKNLRIVGGGK